MGPGTPVSRLLGDTSRTSGADGRACRVCVSLITGAHDRGFEELPVVAWAMLDAGLINREKRGRWSYYSLNPERFAHLTGSLTEYAGRATTN